LFGNTQQIECSEEPWEIMVTEISARCSVSKTRSAVPGTPSMPAPSMLSSARFSMHETPLTGGVPEPPLSMSVPGESGSRVDLICTGIARSSSGASVCGCSTLAPK